jgi:hypothetical protein
MTATIVYCSSNQEREAFEDKIKENLVKVCGDLPIISVTQKPINLGTNICVGDEIGVTGFNFFRQVLIGCEAANTTFIISAEADCLYPPDYFTFRPERTDVCYRNNNLYVMPDKRDYFFHKPGGATHSQIVGREFYIRRLKLLFAGAPMWSKEEKNFPKERYRKEDIFDEILYWTTDNPVFQIKTFLGMRYYTASDRTPIPELPYWGKGSDIYKEYLLDTGVMEYRKAQRRSGK